MLASKVIHLPSKLSTCCFYQGRVHDLDEVLGWMAGFTFKTQVEKEIKWAKFPGFEALVPGPKASWIRRRGTIECGPLHSKVYPFPTCPLHSGLFHFVLWSVNDNGCVWCLVSTVLTSRNGITTKHKFSGWRNHSDVANCDRTCTHHEVSCQNLLQVERVKQLFLDVSQGPWSLILMAIDLTAAKSRPISLKRKPNPTSASTGQKNKPLENPRL